MKTPKVSICLANTSAVTCCFQAKSPQKVGYLGGSWFGVASEEMLGSFMFGTVLSLYRRFLLASMFGCVDEREALNIGRFPYDGMCSSFHPQRFLEHMFFVGQWAPCTLLCGPKPPT